MIVYVYVMSCMYADYSPSCPGPPRQLFKLRANISTGYFPGVTMMILFWRISAPGSY
jgi:hypothetical protein